MCQKYDMKKSCYKETHSSFTLPKPNTSVLCWQIKEGGPWWKGPSVCDFILFSFPAKAVSVRIREERPSD